MGGVLAYERHVSVSGVGFDIACGNMADARGLKIAVRPDMLIIPVELEPEARRILGSEKQNDTANNAINVLRAQGMIPGGVMVSHYMVDSDAYFLTTSITRSGACA